MQTSERSYRCHYTPTDRDGFPVPTETGILPFVQVQAAGAEAAQRAAHHVPLPVLRLSGERTDPGTQHAAESCPHEPVLDLTR